MSRNSGGVCADLVDLRREPAPSVAVTVTARPQTVTLDLARTAIIVVDMQNDFCHPDGASNGIGAPARPGGSPTLEKDSWSAAIVDELKPETGDLSVDKYRMSGFFDTPLDSILRNLNVTTLLFGGVNVDQCFGFVTTSTALLAGAAGAAREAGEQ